METKYVRVISKRYENSSGRIILEKGGSLFPMTRGLTQGCCLSPLFLNATLQRIFKQVDWSNSGIEIDGMRLAELRYANDRLIIDSNKSKLIENIETLSNLSRDAGLLENWSKFKFLTNTNDTNIKIGDRLFNMSDEEKYLGQILSFKNRQELEVQDRITSSWRAFWSLKRFFLRQSSIIS